jgi:fatty-acyl-CoA synthase
VRLAGPPLAPPSFATVNEALGSAAEGDDGVVLVDAREQETWVPYSSLLASASRVAGALIERGVAPGERVALVLPTGRDFLDAFFGVQLAGAVPVPLYPPVRLGRMDEYAAATARMLGVAGAVALITDGKVRLLLGRAIEKARPRLGVPTAAELRDAGVAQIREVDASTLGVVQFSSGSTVDPKPVALSHANLMAQCAALKALLDRRGTRQVGVSWLPLFHDMGLIGCLLTAVYYGKKLVLIPPEVFLARPALWLRAISRHRGTASPAPSFAYGLCLKRIREEELAGVDLSSWAMALNGAEPVSAEVLRRFSEKFAPYGLQPRALRPVYGLSESSLAVTFSADNEPPGCWAWTPP